MNDDLQHELINDYLIECFEGLDRLDETLLALESGQRGSDHINNAFRIIHSVKGTSGCVGLTRTETLAHVAENLMSLVRDGSLQVTSEIISTLLKLSDTLRRMLHDLEKSGAESTIDYSALLAELQRLQIEDSAAAPAPPPEPVRAAAPVAAPAPAPPANADAGFGFFTEPAPAEPRPAAAPAAAPAIEAPADPAAGTSAEPSIADSAIRVGIAQLDRLMNLVGELVLARNQILQHTANTQNATLHTAGQRLNLITTELQESVMKTRMQPINNVWSKFPRIVRDLAHELGKQVRLEMFGSKTELDRTIIEAIKDPLTHIVRNSIDHGIETPDQRIDAGKDEEGNILMRAYHEGGQVNIEIMDDGAGIDLARVKEKAIQKGVITAEYAARMTEREATNLIFHPGLSTAQKVTNVSGRGVGMDVVRTNIEKIGGSIDVQTQRMEGTTLKIKIPLTLAIIPALIVTSRGERYAIPQVSLVELVRLEGNGAQKGIENLFGAPVYRLRGKLLPIVYLDRELNPAADDSARPKRDVVNMVVLHADGSQFGLVVDEINDTQEIVVKPLGKYLKGISVFAGATIMGDGYVSLILDILGLGNRAKALAERETTAQEAAPQAIADARQRLLIFKLGSNERMSVPLSTVGRLEKLRADSVEQEGPREVVQYRGQIMPLYRLANIVGTGESASTASGELPVVVYSQGGRSLGLVVGEIVDVVEEKVTLEKRAPRQGILGSAVIQGRVTEMLDVPALISQLDPELAQTKD